MSMLSILSPIPACIVVARLQWRKIDNNDNTQNIVNRCSTGSSGLIVHAKIGLFDWLRDGEICGHKGSRSSSSGTADWGGY